MGTYTIREEKKVDEAIEKDLRHIVDRVKEALPVRAIILGGGFGRGEGSVIVADNQVKPVNDYDIFLVVSDDQAPDVRPLQKKLAGELGIRLIDLIVLSYSSLPTLPPTQANYDLKYSGRLLWGENCLDLIPHYEQGRLDHASGRVLLLNRLVCALEAYSEDFELRTMTADERFFLVNQTGKVVSACVEALLIKTGNYHHCSQKRQELFEAAFPEHEALKQLNKEATEFKLMPSPSPDVDALTYWKAAVSEYLNVIGSFLFPKTRAPKEELWRQLKQKKAALTEKPIERIELMLLLCREASPGSKGAILKQAHRELEALAGTTPGGVNWESLRKITARLWHELYH